MMAEVICLSLNSGSNGNSIYVQAGGSAVLIDAGLSARRTVARLTQRGLGPEPLRAVLVSHDHHDHLAGAGVVARRLGLPVWMTPGTGASACGLGPIEDIRFFTPGQVLRFGALTVETYPTPHDAAEPVVFVVQAGRRRVGVLTDLGCVFDGLTGLLDTLDAVFLESNYDPEMLASGPYPPALKRRITGGSGHLSNVESAELAARLDGRAQWVALSHLSEVNNTPQLALATHRRTLGARVPLHVAGRHGPGRVLTVR